MPDESIQVTLMWVIFAGEVGLYIYYAFLSKNSERAEAWQKIRAVAHGFALSYFFMKLAFSHMLQGIMVEDLAELTSIVFGGGVVLEYLVFSMYRFWERNRNTANLSDWCLNEFSVISVGVFILLSVVELCVVLVWYAHSILPLACIAALIALVGASYVYFSAERRLARQRQRESQRWAGRSRRRNIKVERPPQSLPSAKVETPPPNQPTRRQVINPFVNPTRTPIPIGPNPPWRKETEPPKPEAAVPQPEDAPEFLIQGRDYRMRLANNNWTTLKSEGESILIFCKGVGSLEGLDLFVWWPENKLHLWGRHEVLGVSAPEVITCKVMRIIEIKVKWYSRIIEPQTTSVDLPDTTAM